MALRRLRLEVSEKHAVGYAALHLLGGFFSSLAGGLLLALLFIRMTRYFNALRALVFMPKYIATSTSAIIFVWMLNGPHGIVNWVLGLLGIVGPDWLADSSTALAGILMLTFWRTVGYAMMIYLSAMKGIPQDYYEAASIDGADKMHCFRFITLPMLAPTTLFLLVTTFISSMKVFQSVDVMTSGGPYDATMVMVQWVYNLSVQGFPRGSRGSCIAGFSPCATGLYHADNEVFQQKRQLRPVREEKQMKKTDFASQLRRMQMHGWFDVLIKLLAIALAIGLGALGGQISYGITAKSFTAEMGAYERAEALGWFAKNRAVLAVIAALIAGYAVIGLLLMRFVSPVLNRTVRRQLAMRRVSHAAQTIGATLVSIVMLFPIYWMDDCLLQGQRRSCWLPGAHPVAPAVVIWQIPTPTCSTARPSGLLPRQYPGQHTLCIMAGQLAIGVLAAYGFSKGEFKGKNALFHAGAGRADGAHSGDLRAHLRASWPGWAPSTPSLGLILPNLVSARTSSSCSARPS